MKKQRTTLSKIVVSIVVIFMVSSLSSKTVDEITKDYEFGLDEVEIQVEKTGNSLNITTSNLEKRNEIAGVISFQFNLKFNPEVHYISNELGEIAKNGTVIVNDRNRGILRVAYMNMYPLTGSGRILTLEFSDEVSDYVLSDFFFNTKEISKINYSDESEEGGNLISTKLIGNHPNPFKNYTDISFALNPNVENATIGIYNVKGQLVQVLEVGEQNMEDGKFSIKWNAENQASGIYFYKLTAGNYSSTKKMILMK